MREKLPVGAYVCKVKQVAVQQNSYGNVLCLLYDIVEGDYQGYYNRDYQGQNGDAKKWRGVMRVWIPQDDGSDKDEKTKRAFKGMVTSPATIGTGTRTALLARRLASSTATRSGSTTARRAGRPSLCAACLRKRCATVTSPFRMTSPCAVMHMTLAARLQLA